MKHQLFPIALGTLTLLKLSQFSLAAGVEESKLNKIFRKLVKTEESQKQQPQIKAASISIPHSKYTRRFPLTSLEHSLFQRIAWFLPPEDVLQLAQVSPGYLRSVGSQLPLELSLEFKNLTEEDFLRYFGQNGYYKEAQCLKLSNSSFNPTWLKHLPKTLKALKLISINTKRLSEYEFSSKSINVI